MPLNRRRVDDTAGEQIRRLQETRSVSDAEKQSIRAEHERIARMVAAKAQRRG